MRFLFVLISIIFLALASLSPSLSFPTLLPFHNDKRPGYALFCRGMTTDDDSSSLQKYLEHWLVLPEGTNGKLYCHVLTENYSHNQSNINNRKEYLCSKHLILIFQRIMIDEEERMNSETTINQSDYENHYKNGNVVINHSPRKKPSFSYNGHVNNINGNGSILSVVFGMTVFEYANCSSPNKKERAYIQYVDSTGAFSPRHLQGCLSRSVVACYARYCRDVLGMNFLHLFASSKPSLLFSGSEMLKGKKILDGKSLIFWWCSLLHACLADMPARCHLIAREEYPLPSLVFSPSHFNPQSSFPLTLTLTLINKESMENGNENGNENENENVKADENEIKENSSKSDKENQDFITWTRELPYNLEEIVSNGSIPFFEDDPKLRHWENLEEIDAKQRKRLKRQEINEITIGEFFETIWYRGEFCRDHVAFIVIQLLPPNSSICSSIPSSSFDSFKQEIGKGVNDEKNSKSMASVSLNPNSNSMSFNSMNKGTIASFGEKILKTLTFESQESLIRNSQKLYSWLKLVGSQIFQIKIDSHLAWDHERSLMIYKSLLGVSLHSYPSSSLFALRNVNSIHGNDGTGNHALGTDGLVNNVVIYQQDIQNLIKRKRSILD